MIHPPVFPVPLNRRDTQRFGLGLLWPGTHPILPREEHTLQALNRILPAQSPGCRVDPRNPDDPERPMDRAVGDLRCEGVDRARYNAFTVFPVLCIFL